MCLIETTDQGFLKNWQKWTPEIALALAQQQKLTLTKSHWCVIHFARDFFAQYEYSPIQRLIVKQLQTFDEKASSLDLKAMFPEGPRQICLIAGLPKPARCV
jgi:tRNA 2-thiouridine synthesizing protein E